MVGRPHAFTQVLVIANGRKITVASLDGEILAEHTRPGPGVTYGDLDHSIPFVKVGGTLIGPGTVYFNLGAVCRFHHQIKAMPGWHLEQDRGRFLWTTPNGMRFIVHRAAMTTNPPTSPPTTPPTTSRRTDGDLTFRQQAAGAASCAPRAAVATSCSDVSPGAMAGPAAVATVSSPSAVASTP
jgi:hypothetical protein